MSLLFFRQLVALAIILLIGPVLGYLLVMNGLIAETQIELLNSLVWYFYFPLSGLLLCGCFLGMILTSESKNGQLQLNQSQPWMSVIKFWCALNQWMATACTIFYFFTMFRLLDTIFRAISSVTRH